MFNFFNAGRELVYWDLTVPRPNGPYRLAMHHTNGHIVEFFDDLNDALRRQGELEELLIAARGAGHASIDSIEPYVPACMGRAIAATR